MKPAVTLLATAVCVAVLAAGDDRQAVARDGTTPLHLAARAGDAAAVTRLLREGADARAANRYGVTPLALAAENGSAAVINALLGAGADPNGSLSNGQTMLMIAARTGNPDAIKALVARGANVQAKESVLGENAVIWAAVEDHAAAVAALAAAGADVNARSDVTKFPRRDYGDGKSGRFTVLPRGGWTPLMYAARQDARAAAGALIAAGARLNAIDPDGTTALTFAIINAHYDLAAALIEAGADPNIADVRGMTPLYAAVDMNTLDETPGRPAPKINGSLDTPQMIERLLARGADPNAALKGIVLERVHNNGDPVLGDGATPLMRAARKADVPAMRLLLAHGADATRTMRGGVTAAMIASGFGGQVRFAEYNQKTGTEHDAEECVRLCLEGGADVNAVNDAGQTVLHIAAAQRDERFIRFLVARGARLGLRDKQGRTPLDVAMGVGGGRGRGGRAPAAREPIAAVLRELGAER